MAGGIFLPPADVLRNDPRFADSPKGLVVRPVVPRYSVSLFGEQRVAQEYALGEIYAKYGASVDGVATEVSGTGTVTDVTAQSSVRMTVAANGDTARVRSKEYYRYQPGHCTRVRLSVYLSSVNQANRVARWGQFDDNDGLFFSHQGNATSVVTRSSTSGAPVETAVLQANWNIDPLDGSGPSGMTLDLTKENLFEIEYQWLGVGDVLWVVNGIPVHLTENPGQLSVPYMKTAVLPLSWEMVSTGGVGSLTSTCSNVGSEGGALPPFRPYGVPGAIHTVSVAPGETVLNLRLKATLNGVSNRVQVHPVTLYASNVGARAVVGVLRNATLTGVPAWVSANAQSGVEYDVSNTTFTGGSSLAVFTVESGTTREINLVNLFDQRESALRRAVFAAGTDDTLSVVAYRDLGAGTTDVRASMNWQEVR